MLPLLRMNSLNILTSRVSPPPSPGQSRSNSIASLSLADLKSGSSEKHSYADDDTEPPTQSTVDDLPPPYYDDKASAEASEHTPLLGDSKDVSRRSRWWHSVPRRATSGLISSIRWFFVTLASPGVYLIACFYDEDGNFAPFYQLKKLFGVHKGRLGDMAVKEGRAAAEKGAGKGRTRAPRVSSWSGSSGSEDEKPSQSNTSGTKKQTRLKSQNQTSSDETSPARRSIRIKLNNDEAMRERKHKRSQSNKPDGLSGNGGDDLLAQLKSPTSPIAALTKYPKTPAPPRPLIPRRQPSYLNFEPSQQQKKTLILDLDETLIHSMSKGGRMSTGHMVEVRLNTASLGMGAGGPGGMGQHPILYWVNKRPFCDEFLRRVVKWFNLVIFTASVQEYADPVIDWLETERKFFSARYYRQHCTYRQGAYIKDLSSVEPDLSNVMILDNSPLSYLFHEDNAIPIQGWINDPTDSDLMHLVPLLEGLQYVHDVRALLALRGGEDGQHPA